MGIWKAVLLSSREASPYKAAPRPLIRDRDATYGEWLGKRVRNLGTDEVVIAPRSPWQNHRTRSWGRGAGHRNYEATRRNSQ